MTEIGNSVERVRVALQKAGHPDTIEVFPDGTRTAQDAAAAVGCIGRPRVFIDADLMTLDLIWAAAGSPHHVFRSTPSELVRLTGGTIVDVKEE